MYIKRLLKQRFILSVITFLIAGTILLSSSFALFTKVVSNDNNQNLALGDLAINFAKGSTITKLNIDPVADEIALSNNEYLYTFTVRNNGDVSYAYKIYLNDNPDYLEGGSSYSSSINLLSHSYLKYTFSDNTIKELRDLQDNTLYSHIIDPGELESFSLRVWVPNENLPNSALGSEIHLKISVDGKASPSRAEMENPDSDEYTPGAGEPFTNNPPKLANNLIPVYYDETNDVWKKADPDNTDNIWYDYENQKWANAVTVTSGTRANYNSAPLDTTISMSDILGMFAWIPRYEYISSNLGSNFAGGSLALPGPVTIKFLKGTSTREDSGYFIHPAFRDGSKSYLRPDGTTASNYDLGGWDKELTGFWFGKFDTGSTTQYTSEKSTLTEGMYIKPNMYGLCYQTMLNQYNTAINVASYYGIDSALTSHMSKNDEWGAVVYLTQSMYGKYGNDDYTGASKEVYINEAHDILTDYVSGRSFGTYADENNATSTKKYGKYEYNNCNGVSYAASNCALSERQANATKGTGASTTGNIYGIYDMSGGISNRVAANYNNLVASSGFTTIPTGKYFNIYTTDEGSHSACNGACYGHALALETGNMYESAVLSWYNDESRVPVESSPFITNGGMAGFYTQALGGILAKNTTNGEASGLYGFRITVIE